jgi:hypothetical protein
MSDTVSADTKVGSGAATAPAAGATVAAVTGLSPGSRYRLRIALFMGGTVDTTNIQNLILTSGGATIISNLPSVAGLDPIEIDQLTPQGVATDFTVKVGAANFAAASIIAAVITATRIG